MVTTKEILSSPEPILPGHAACAGCSSSLGLRYALKALGENVIMTIPACCTSVWQGPYPKSAITVPVLNIAFDIASFGMEGVSIGCAFIIGDVEEVMHRSHQLVLNPYYGHRREERDVLDPSTWETVKEFAQLDGVIVIDDEGIVVAAGRYLDVDASEISIKQGLGARHAAVAAITRDTQAVGVAVSQTGGTIRIFKDGIAVVEIDPTTKITGVRGIGVK